MNADLVLTELMAVLQSRLPSAGGDPDSSYVAKLYAKGPDAFLKKIGEEATEVVMAAKDQDRQSLVSETADLWFHCLVALNYYDIEPAQVFAELAKRQGISGLVEKANRS
ncbi:phosphoribosyl-ATP diphosphatase [Paenalcaligenes hominis]|uniref:phosphoribosyl-ATP diphosphatase n=1 Tax=Paenalcaligenes hominis TaxID=643674 RepID=UPI003523AF8C